ncbi:unnamed protein product [Rhizoctonia solani]|uniref:Uncharacterized protein n=1 Tax=Rhizoctonia solani TaxID=456999 RepID=A0A8H3HAL8_9AGAM|nr:unnamed protein product [Rhizoctonia solani]
MTTMTTDTEPKPQLGMSPVTMPPGDQMLPGDSIDHPKNPEERGCFTDGCVRVERSKDLGAFSHLNRSPQIVPMAATAAV